MKTGFMALLTLLWGWQLFVVLPDLLSVKAKEVKVLDITCIERDDGYFSPLIAYEGGEEVFVKQSYKNPDKCVDSQPFHKGDSIMLYQKLYGGETLDPSLPLKTYLHLFLLIIATLFIMFRF